MGKKVIDRTVIKVDGDTEDARKEAKKLKKELKGVERGLSMLQTAGKAGLAALGLGGIGAVTRQVADTSLSFEDMMANIQSLTNLSTTQVEKLEERIRGLAQTSRKNALEVGEGFLLVGSQMPQLFNDLEGFGRVVEKVLQVAEGNVANMGDAAQLVALALNAWGMEAKNVDRVVNLLGASIQNGAAFFDDLLATMKKTAAGGDSVKVSFEEMVVLTQLLSKQALTAEQAGTKLNGILLTLATSSDKNLQPAVVGVVQAIKNLKKQNLDTQSLKKLFKQENFNAINSLIKTIDQADDLMKTISGTTAALNQQAVMASTTQAAVDSLSSSWADLQITLGKNGLNDSISGGSGFLKNFIDEINLVMRIAEEPDKKRQEALAKLGRRAGDDKKIKVKGIKDLDDSLLKAFFEDSTDFHGFKKASSELGFKEAEKRFRSQERTRKKKTSNRVKAGIRFSPDKFHSLGEFREMEVKKTEENLFDSFFNEFKKNLDKRLKDGGSLSFGDFRIEGPPKKKEEPTPEQKPNKFFGVAKGAGDITSGIKEFKKIFEGIRDEVFTQVDFADPQKFAETWLSKLELLRNKGLITLEQYTEFRAEVLDQARDIILANDEALAQTHELWTSTFHSIKDEVLGALAEGADGLSDLSERLKQIAIEFALLWGFQKLGQSLGFDTESPFKSRIGVPTTTSTPVTTPGGSGNLGKRGRGDTYNTFHLGGTHINNRGGGATGDLQRQLYAQHRQIQRLTEEVGRLRGVR